MTDLDDILAYLAETLDMKREFSDEDGCIHTQDPRVHLLSGDGMLEIIEKVRYMNPYGYELWRDRKSVWFWSADDADGFLSHSVHFSTATPWPEAVARAAYAALKEQS